MFTTLAETVSYYTTTSSDTSLPAAAWVAIVLVVLALVALGIVTMWKIFTKAGEKGWKSIIPFYNTWILAELAGKPGWWSLASFLGVIPFVGGLIGLVVYVLIYLDLAKAFGKSSGFGVLLILVPVVGFPMLAFGSATYVGTKYDTMGNNTPAATPAV